MSSPFDISSAFNIGATPYGPQQDAANATKPSDLPSLAQARATSSKASALALVTIANQSHDDKIARCKTIKENLEITLRDLGVFERQIQNGSSAAIPIQSLISLCDSKYLEKTLKEALCRGTPNKEVELEILKTNPNLLFDIKSVDGTILIDQIKTKINELIQVINKEIEVYQQRPSASLSEIKRYQEEFGQIQSASFDVFECPVHYSQEMASLAISQRQIQNILQHLSKSNTTKAMELIRRLDKNAILTPLCHLMWEIDGQINNGDLDYGFHAIERNPSRLLDIRDAAKPSGKNILEQIDEFLSETFQHRMQVHLLEMLQVSLSDGMDNDKAKTVLSYIHKESPSLFGKLCLAVYTRDKDKDPHNPSLQNYHYGQREIEKNIRTLNEGEDSILQQVLTEVTTTAPTTVKALVKQESRYQTNAERIHDLVSKGQGLKVAMLSAELKGIVAEGGLGEAVLGMALALNDQGNPITVIMPRYDDAILPKNIREKLQKPLSTDTITVEDDGSEKTHNIYAIQVGSTDKPLDVLMIEDAQYFTVGTNAEGTANKIYGSQSRFMQFQKLGAALCQKLYTENKVDVIHLQDSQTALVPTMLAHSSSALQDRPPAVFTFHNNGYAAQCCYGNQFSDHPQDILGKMGLGYDSRNAFVEGMRNADAVTTVSSKFAEEACFGKELERNVGHEVRRAAYQGKLFDVLNGINSSGWDPKKNGTLKSWVCVRSLEATGAERTLSLDPATFIGKSAQEADALARQFKEDVKLAVASGAKVKVDLSYGKDDHPLYIACKKELCKIEMAAYLEKYELGRIDPHKPLLLNIGRFDASQKGIDKIPLIIDLVKKADAQIVCIGLDGDTCPEMGQLLKAEKYHKKNGVIVIQDEKVDGKIKWQMGHKNKATGADIPGFGPLLRAAADAGVFPSEFEPCGLVQGESFMMGTRVLTTDTGGFHDTVFTEGERRNGWRFTRAATWKSAEQNEEIKKVIPAAVQEIKGSIYSDNLEEKMKFYEQTKAIMHNAELMDWTKKHPSDAMTPVEKLQAVYAFAKQKSRRGYEHFSLKNVSAF